jgi:DNA-binding NarL/FixJ family response regulator
MIRTLIVDDQNLIREGIRVLLEKASEIEIVGDASNGETALEKIEAIQPDIVLLDIDMPGIDGLTVADTIRLKFPSVKVIMLSSHEDRSYIQRSTAVGAKGYLLKNATSEELEWSIKLVHQGYSTIKSNLTDKPLAQKERSELYATPAPEPNLPSKSNVALKPSYSFVGSEKPKPSPDELELFSAKNQVSQKYLTSRQQRRKKRLFHRSQLNKVKRTMISFEFRLLVLSTLSCLGFLVFVALS